mmetsp:Transcript_28930/g.83579  ORF Transcript_28930/g.83579 Transcript_28930/m.83579 type:complete len:106 (-) Transcript_28930:230-547(-)
MNEPHTCSHTHTHADQTVSNMQRDVPMDGSDTSNVYVCLSIQADAHTSTHEDVHIDMVEGCTERGGRTDIWIKGRARTGGCAYVCGYVSSQTRGTDSLSGVQTDR